MSKNFDYYLANSLENHIAENSVEDMFMESLLKSQKLLDKYKDDCKKAIRTLYNQAKAGFDDDDVAVDSLIDVLTDTLPKEIKVNKNV